MLATATLDLPSLNVVKSSRLGLFNGSLQCLFVIGFFILRYIWWCRYCLQRTWSDVFEVTLNVTSSVALTSLVEKHLCYERPQGWEVTRLSPQGCTTGFLTAGFDVADVHSV